MGIAGLWYGENRSRRERPWSVGDLVRYGDGSTALMRVEDVRGNPNGDIARNVSYYGRAFHSQGACTFAYHGKCLEPSDDDRASWANCHDENDAWIRGAYA